MSPATIVTFWGVTRKLVGSIPNASAVTTDTLAVRTLPAASDARTAIVEAPAATTAEHVNVPSENSAGCPLQVTTAVLETASLTVPATDEDPAGTIIPVRGDEIERKGAVLSRFTVNEAVAEWPPSSVAVPLISCVPSEVTTIGDGHVTVPGPAQTNDTVASALFHPAPFG